MREMAGAGAIGSAEHVPTFPGLSQDCPGGQEASAQHTSSTQLPEMQSTGSSQLPPFGAGVLDGVAVGVAVADGVAVGVSVGVAVAVEVGVSVGVEVGVSAAEPVQLPAPQELSEKNWPPCWRHASQPRPLTSTHALALSWQHAGCIRILGQVQTPLSNGQ